MLLGDSVSGVERVLPVRDLVTVVVAEGTRRVLGEGVAVALPVGGPHEGRDDLDVPLADIGRLPPEVRQAEVDVELEEIDAARLIHAESVRAGSDGNALCPGISRPE